MVDAAIAAFALDLEALGRSPKTVEAYTSAVRRVLNSLKDGAHELSLSDITPIDLGEWKRHRVAAAKPATVNLETDALRQFFRFLQASGSIPTDPSTRLKHVPDAAFLAPKWLTRQEQYQLVRALQRNVQSANTDRRRALALRDVAVVALMLHAGLRPEFERECQPLPAQFSQDHSCSL